MATITDRYILEVDTKGGVANMNAAGAASVGLGSKLRGLGPLAIAAAGALAGIGAIAGIKGVVDDMDDLAKAARNVGVTTASGFEEFQVISKTLGEMGITSSETDRAFRNLTTRMQKAADTGKGPAAAAFEKLGDRVLDANGKLLDMPQLFTAVTGAIQDGTLNVNDAQAAFGEMVGPKILGGFEDLAAKGLTVSDAFADVAANSNIVSLDAANNAESFNDTLGRLQEVAGRLGTEVATALLPVLQKLAEGALAVLPGFIDGVKVAFEALRPIIDALVPVGQALFDLLQALWPVFETLLSVIGPVVGILADGLTGAINAVIAVISTVVEAITGFIDKIKEISGAVGEVAGAVGDKWNGMTEGMANGAKAAADKVTGFFGGMYDTVVGNSIIPDMADGVLGTFDTMTGGMVSKIGGVIGDVTNSFQGVAQAISNQFENLTGVSLGNIRSQVESLSASVGSRINNLATSVRSRFGSIVSGAGSIADSLGLGDLVDSIGNFAGGFATGGTIPSNSFGLVGERGPELVSGPARITPLTDLGSQNVTYNINAVDASSFRDLIARDPAFIHAVAAQGATRFPQRRKL